MRAAAADDDLVPVAGKHVCGPATGPPGAADDKVSAWHVVILPDHQGRGRPSRKKPPVGPLSGKGAAHATLAAPSSTGRPPGPPMSVAVQPGQTALTRMR